MLYFASNIQDASYYAGDDIVIGLDPDYDGGNLPQNDDFQLYMMRNTINLNISEGNGNGWSRSDDSTGIIYRTSSFGNIWQMESCLSHSRMRTSTNHIMGIEFRSYDNNPHGWFNYPEDGDEENPNTWMKMLLVDHTNTQVSRISKPVNYCIFPNPFSQVTRIIIEHKNVTFELFNAHGQLVRKVENINPGQFNINRDNLKNGIYFYCIYNKDKILKNGKLIIK